MEDVVVVGVGMTRFTKAPERTLEDMGHEAVLAAMNDAGVERADIGAAICGTLRSHPGIGQRVLKDLGMTGIPIVNVENACASGSTALREAMAWIRAGFADVVLAVGVESLSAQPGLVSLGVDDYVWGSGLVLPGAYALTAKRHMAMYGTTPEHFAKVSVKSHDNAMLNPFAHFHKPVSVEDVLGSAMIADPITIYQCCPNTDGAAAAIVASASAARRFTADPIKIAGSALNSGRLVTQADAESDLTKRTADAAYEMAGIGPEDVDLAEVHDAFAPGELIYYEELGFCGEGEGGAYIDAGRSAIGGDGVAVNPSGGLLSRGHPFGATGLAQIAELTWHLRGRAGERQVPDAKVGLAHTMGGTLFELEANACAIHILTT
ncbi:MAG: thiolase family protein [Actinomycetota bacterium]